MAQVRNARGTPWAQQQCNAAVPVCMWILLEEQRPHGLRWRPQVYYQSIPGHGWNNLEMTNRKTLCFLEWESG